MPFTPWVQNLDHAWVDVQAWSYVALRRDHHTTIAQPSSAAGRAIGRVMQGFSLSAPRLFILKAD